MKINHFVPALRNYCLLPLFLGICYSQNTITTVDAIGIVGSDCSIAISKNGFPIISYYDQTNGNLKLVKCGNASCSTNNVFVLADTISNVGARTFIKVPSDGLPIVGYLDVSNFDLKILKCGDSSCVSGNYITKVDSIGDVGFDASIAIPSDKLPFLSYYDATRKDLKVLKCGNTACSNNNAIARIDTVGSVGDFTSVAISSDGLPVISYLGKGLKVLKCGNSFCSSGNTITVVDSSFAAGYFTSIAIGLDGLPLVAYSLNNSFATLKVLKCGNISCSIGNKISVVDTGRVGEDVSVSIPADGLPIISYLDVSNYDLKVVKCGNSSCSSGNVITRLDTLGNVGVGTSIAVPTDNLPVISYWRLSSADLKVVKCGTPTCGSPTALARIVRQSTSDVDLSVVGSVVMLYLYNHIHYHVQIFNIQGQKVYDSIMSGPSQLKIPALKRGMHFVRVISRKGVSNRRIGIF